jgi:hypothetical protein
LNSNKEKLKKIQKYNFVTGFLLLLPLLLSILPKNIFELTVFDEQDISIIQMVLGLMLWTMLFTWFVRLRKIKDIKLIFSSLFLVAGQVNLVFFISAWLGAGVFSLALACMIPYSLSLHHTNKIKELLSEEDL